MVWDSYGPREENSSFRQFYENWSPVKRKAGNWGHLENFLSAHFDVTLSLFHCFFSILSSPWQNCSAKESTHPIQTFSSFTDAGDYLGWEPLELCTLSLLHLFGRFNAVSFNQSYFRIFFSVKTRQNFEKWQKKYRNSIVTACDWPWMSWNWRVLQAPNRQPEIETS